MEMQVYILFCENPLKPNSVDEDFEDEWIAAKGNGFEILLVDFETLTSTNRNTHATKRIKRVDNLTNIIYRGWMLTPKQYSILYRDLLAKNFKLINTPKQYQNCHYLPDSLRFIENNTPKTIFEKFEDENSIDKLLERAKIFGQKSVILKDYVKSEKHDWETACFVWDASDTNVLRQTIKRFIELRGVYLNEGIVVREFIQLNKLTNHSKSGMPLTEEYRLFFCNKKLIAIYEYWEEGEYQLSKPDISTFEEIAKKIESGFFSMDIARQQNGEFTIIELGDGQVAGLPDKVSRNEFYKILRELLFKLLH